MKNAKVKEKSLCFFVFAFVLRNDKNMREWYMTRSDIWVDGCQFLYSLIGHGEYVSPGPPIYRHWAEIGGVGGFGGVTPVKDNGDEVILDTGWGTMRGVKGDFLDFYKSNWINDDANWWGEEEWESSRFGREKKNSLVT